MSDASATVSANEENSEVESGEHTLNMAMHLGLPPSEPLDLSSGNVSESWKKFKQKYTNYEIATGIHTKESATRVATLLTIIGNDAIEPALMFLRLCRGIQLAMTKRFRRSSRSSKNFANRRKM